tara:strand:- start:647 stop:1135 length:489 start_codon:yes stop_codon:yes gene_type:complete
MNEIECTLYDLDGRVPQHIEILEKARKQGHEANPGNWEVGLIEVRKRISESRPEYLERFREVGTEYDGKTRQLFRDLRLEIARYSVEEGLALSEAKLDLVVEETASDMDWELTKGKNHTLRNHARELTGYAKHIRQSEKMRETEKREKSLFQRVLDYLPVGI